jgi:polysaccharide export outer membrane protein
LKGLLASCVLVLGACGYSPVRPTPLDELLRRSAQLDSGGYTAQVGDVLTVRFYFNPELDFDALVRSDGSISLSLVGDIPAAGRRAPELSAAITDAYRAYLNQPNATVILRTPAGHRVYVTGEVYMPGVFTLQGSETALSAISMAGGLTDRSSLKQVVLVRRLPGDAQPMVTVLNLYAALTASDPRQDVKILLNDVLYVPRTGSAEANVDLKNVIWGKGPLSVYGSVVYNGTITK